MNPFLVHSAAFCAAFLLALALTPVVRRMAIRLGCVAVPRQDRWAQKTTGLFGGVAIYVSLTAAWLLAAWGLCGFETHVRPLLPVALGAVAMFGLGLADDVADLNPQYKLIGQVAAACLLVMFGFQFDWFASRTADLVVSVFWVVGITNAFNLLDNMDGLSAGVAAIAGCFLFLWLLPLSPGVGPPPLPAQVMLAAYIGALLGFLCHNFHPASIFMGDAGSLLIGFTLSALTLTGPLYAGQESSPSNVLSVVVVPCLILFLPILDTTFVSIMRKRFRRSVFQGGRDHSSHRLVAIGLSERNAVLVLYGFAAAAGLLALGVRPLGLWVSLAMIALYLVLVLLFWIYLSHVRVYEAPSPRPGKPKGESSMSLVKAGHGRAFFSLLLDLALITVAYYTAYLLRFGGHIGPDFHHFLRSLPIVFACQIAFLVVFGAYQRLWRSSRLEDLTVYVRAVTAGTVATVLVLVLVYRFEGFSRAVFIIYWGVMLILLAFSRFFFRFLDDWAVRKHQRGKPALIYGAGVGGQMAVREIETNPAWGLFVVGFIDDDPRKKGKTLHGYPVFGGKERLVEMVRKRGVREIIISFRENSLEKKKEIRKLGMKMGLEAPVSRLEITIRRD